MSLLPKIISRNDEEREADLEWSLIRKEAKIGGALFGPIAKGHNREFFCLDEHVWVWREEWTNEDGQRKTVTTRYYMEENGALKLQDGQVRQRLSLKEARNLYRAIELYCQRIGDEYQRILQAA